MKEIERNRTAEIIRLHEGIMAAFEKTLPDMIRLGELLTEQKASLQRGDFTAWVKNNMPFTDRAARRYMGIYRDRHRLKTDRVSGLTAAYRLLEAPKPDLLAKLESRLSASAKTADPSDRFREIASIARDARATRDPEKYGGLYGRCVEVLSELLAPAEGFEIFGFAPTRQEHLAVIPQAPNLFTIWLFEPTLEWAERVLSIPHLKNTEHIRPEDLLKSKNDFFCIEVVYNGTITDEGDLMVRGSRNVWRGFLFERLHEVLDIDNTDGILTREHKTERTVVPGELRAL
ncbi:MAG: DUF3102 domain-containing protein [Planctomycetota bacterium]|jgi:hypothetical protein